MRSQFPRFFARSWFFVLGCACVILAAGCAAGGNVAFDPADLFYRETATLPIIASARPTRTPTITATPIYTASPTMTATPTQTPVPIVTRLNSSRIGMKMWLFFKQKTAYEIAW